MLWKRIKLFWKSGLTIVISLLLMPAVSGCSDTSSKEAQVEKNAVRFKTQQTILKKKQRKLLVFVWIYMKRQHRKIEYPI